MNESENAMSTSISSPEWQRLRDEFLHRFAAPADLLVRAPGRVNLIGEHTDYNGYPVLPLAIDREIRIAAVRRPDDQVLMQNGRRAFAERFFRLSEATVPFALGDWGNYVKAALAGLQDRMPHSARGFTALFDGTVPPAAGLSSSSALVVASALLFLHVNEVQVDRLELADVLARAERFVGTAGGGMDQAASLLGRPGHALKIDFFPLRVRPVALPFAYRVVICNSLIAAPKTESALLEYNRRPLECRLAVLLLCRYLSHKTGRPVSAQRLADLAAFPLSEEEAASVLGPQSLSLAQLLDRLQMSLPELLRVLHHAALQTPQDGFKLLPRYLHVVREAARVQAACEALEQGDAEEMGRLMAASHESCRSLYEISTAELDRLVEIALEQGAVGSRLTGAGVGGCTVSLVAREKVPDFIPAVTRDYYETYLACRRPETMEKGLPPDAIFATEAAAGAGLIV